mmetsp:Transcript_26707/g.62093  ORF Transcript_26707/g.62093 Transcript_26707/m.62093 type:complete len:152 (-) Transcript_26707:113-568(-)
MGTDHPKSKRTYRPKIRKSHIQMVSHPSLPVVFVLCCTRTKGVSKTPPKQWGNEKVSRTKCNKGVKAKNVEMEETLQSSSSQLCDASIAMNHADHPMQTSCKSIGEYSSFLPLFVHKTILLYLLCVDRPCTTQPQTDQNTKLRAASWSLPC